MKHLWNSTTNQEVDMRTHVVMPKGLVASIDRIVGQRGRSHFLVVAAQHELAHRDLLAVAKRAAGSGKNQQRPWGSTLASISSWLDTIRGDDVQREVQLDAFRKRVAPSV